MMCEWFARGSFFDVVVCLLLVSVESFELGRERSHIYSQGSVSTFHGLLTLSIVARFNMCKCKASKS